MKDLNQYTHTIIAILTISLVTFGLKNAKIISPNSTENHLQQTPLNPLVALEYFLSQQKRSIFSLDKREDSTIQLMYQVSKEKFENECQVEEEKLTWKLSKIYVPKRDSNSRKPYEGESIEKIEKDAKDGEEFFFRQERKFTG